MTYVGRAGFANPAYVLERERWAIGRPSAEAKPIPWAAAPGPARDISAPRRVLIVEDEPIIAMTLEALVEDLGREPCGVAATGVEAVELAKTLKPDVILMDVSLIGEMDGIEAARLAREATGVRVVFVTAYGSGEIMDRIRSIHPGAPVVPKPVDPSSLRRAIEAAEALSDLPRLSAQWPDEHSRRGVDPSPPPGRAYFAAAAWNALSSLERPSAFTIRNIRPLPPEWRAYEPFPLSEVAAKLRGSGL